MDRGRKQTFFRKRNKSWVPTVISHLNLGLYGFLLNFYTCIFFLVLRIFSPNKHYIISYSLSVPIYLSIHLLIDQWWEGGCECFRLALRAEVFGGATLILLEGIWCDRRRKATESGGVARIKGRPGPTLSLLSHHLVLLTVHFNSEDFDLISFFSLIFLIKKPS